MSEPTEGIIMEDKPSQEVKKDEGGEEVKAEAEVAPLPAEEAPAKPADAELEKLVPKEESADPNVDDVAPTMDEAPKPAGETKMMKELDDEAPKTFPQVVSLSTL